MVSVDLNGVEDHREEERLISCLEFEIKRIEEEQKRPGWTKWVIAGTIATAFWLLIGEFEGHAHQLHPRNLCFLVLGIAIFWDWIIATRKLLLLGFPAPDHKARFFRSNLLAVARPVLGAQMLGKLSLLTIAIFSPLLGKDWVGITICCLLTLRILSFIVLLLISYGQVPIPLEVRPKYRAMVVWPNVVSWLLNFLLLLSLARTVVQSSGNFSFSELRSSILINVIFSLIALFLSDNLAAPIVAVLIELRRRLGLRSISYQTAKRQTEVIIEGEDAEAAYRVDADAAIAKFDQLVAEIDTLLRERKADPQAGTNMDELAQKFKSVQMDAELLRMMASVWSLLLPSAVNDLKKLLAAVSEHEAIAKEKVQIGNENFKLLPRKQRNPVTLPLMRPL